MNRKSKLLTFLLSILPGLSYVYLDNIQRGAVFFVSLITNLFIMFFTIEILGIYQGEALVIIFPIIWLIGMVDSMILVDKINKGYINNVEDYNKEFALEWGSKIPNKQVIAMALSIIPGAGHMYLNLKGQGIQLMGAFFLPFFLTDLLEINFLMFLVPMVWFYSLFDAMHKASEENLKDTNIPIFSSLKENTFLIKDKSKILGYLLITIGCIAIFQNILVDGFDALIKHLGITKYISIYEIKRYLTTGIVGIIFIIGGIKLLHGSKKYNLNKEGEI
ncbi:NADPH-dependent FMN reductase family protein [Tepidibacter aestuarii]|uniref:hypothetical protein n=1 Tax=Tepidibacter aestuarii TaxID=2925782 RepID=UPI0020C154DD|nr:hypothetical protein [Tepidibacter aestuarii]CAH2214215.1 conserved membrane protein of unknown function [Tepidibacter aestuarii]